MNTYFFIIVTLYPERVVLKYGPYTTLSSAAEIMVDCLSDFIQAEITTERVEKYEAVLAEYSIQPDWEGEPQWEEINIKATETRRL